MNTISKFFIITILVFCVSLSRSDTLSIFPVIQKTAFLTQPNQLNKSLFTPLTFGLNSRIELQSFPVLNIMMPNFGAKISCYNSSSNKLHLSSMHSLTYFSSWLKFWQGDGTGAIITPQMKIPTMLMIDNGIIVSYIFSPTFLISTNLNFEFIAGKKIDEIYSVDIPMVYPRFAPAFTGSVGSIKTNLQGKLYKRFQYMINLDYYKVINHRFSNFFEGNLMLVYTKSNKFKICAGPIFVFGEYPFGKQWNIIPLLNLYYTFTFYKSKGS